MKLRTPRPALTLALSAALTLTPAVATASTAGADPGTDPFLIQVEQDAVEDVRDTLADLGVPVEAEFTDAVTGFSVDLTDAQVATLARDTDVRTLEPEQPTYLAVEEETTSPQAVQDARHVWGLDRLDQRELPLDVTYRYPDSSGAGVRMYVVDTGVQTGFADFGGRTLPGYTAITDGLGTADCHGHGTHVAGTASGTMWGVAKASTVIPVRVLACAGSGNTTQLAQGLDRIAANHPAGTPGVVNISISGGSTTLVRNAVDNLHARGLLVVVAAGNESIDACLVSPAQIPNAITVAASNRSDGASTFTNHGSCVDVFAPGEQVASLYAPDENLYATMSGTSMASPHVAGLAAVLWAANPGLTPDTLSTRIITGATTGVLVSVPGASTPNRLATLDTSPWPKLLAPSVPQVGAITKDSATLTWAPAPTGAQATTYVVQKATGTTWTTAATLAAPTTSVTLSGLSAATAYQVRVRAESPDQSATSAVASFTTAYPTATAPSAPRSVTALALTPTTARLSWLAPSTSADLVSGYAVQTSTNGTTWITKVNVAA